MNSKERSNLALRREVPDRVPFDLCYGFVGAAYDNFVEHSGGADNHFEYFNTDVEYVEVLEPGARFDFAGRYYRGRLPENKNYEFDRFGILHEKTEGLHFTKIIPPLENPTLNELKKFPLPDYRDTDLYRETARRIAEIDSRGRCSALAMGAETIFEVSWPLTGLENFLVLMLSEPELCEAVFDRFTEMRLVQLETYAGYGRYDVLWLGDDIANQSGMLLPPELWRKMLKPRLKKIIECAKHYQPDGLIFYHTCGNPGEVVEDLIEIGVDILNPVQPEAVDAAGIKTLYGDRLSFWGTVGVQHTLPFGTTEEVKAEVKTRIETVGKDGGLLIGPSHVIEPEVPWTNVLAFVEAVREYGEY
jgi:uroporphyrinogen decarboxylase